MFHADREFSSESHSTTLSEGLVRAMHYATLTDHSTPILQEDSEKSETTGKADELATSRLKRALSTKSVISTTSSFASRMQRAATKTGLEGESLRVIGLGSCGTVFEIPGTELAFKKGTNEQSIWNDFCLTNRVHEAARNVRAILQEAFPNSTIPRTPLCYNFHPANDESFWSTNLHRLPTDYRTKQPLFTVDRILPLPEQTRMDLMEEFFDQDESSQQEAKDDQSNKDCLVRVYLGERESLAQQSNVYDTLRNFPLRLNMIEDIEIDSSELAIEMALGLAIIHWQAQMDGMDMEFVLGSSTTLAEEQPKGYDDVSAPPHKVETVKFKRRAVHFWMLDFDKATAIELRKEDVDRRLVPAFLGNDPYYPRRHVDEKLWDVFCASYLRASELILKSRKVDEQVGKEIMSLPHRFLEEVLRVSQEHENWSEEENIVFRS